MRRPLVPVALCYVVGVLLAEGLELSLLPLFAWSMTLAVVALWRDHLVSLLLGPLLVLTGATHLTMQKSVLAPADLRVLIGARAELIELRGRLRETPYQRLYEHDEQESWRTVAQIDVDAVRPRGADWQSAFGCVAASTAGTLPKEFFGGQRVEVTGVLTPPDGPVAEGLFDYRTYLHRQGIYYQLKVATSNDWRLATRSAPSAPPLADRFSVWAKATLARGLPVEDEPLRLLWAMTLGWKTALTGEVSEPFMRSGTMHVFAISGLHIALIAGILVGVLRGFRVPRGICGAVVIPLIWCYTGVTGWQASAIRSTVMMTVIIAGWSLHRPSDLLNSLAAAALLILLWDPQQLFQASFQLSFFVVLSLALFSPVLRRLQKRLLQPDPFLPDALRPRWQRWSLTSAHYVATGLTTSLAAWLGSIPLVAYYFHLFTPVSLLANLLVVPLSSAALACNLASLAVGAWFPMAAELFNHSAWFWMMLMVRISGWAAQMPGGCFHVATPRLLTFVLYYVALISVMAGWLVKPKVRVWTRFGLLLLAGAWLVTWQVQRSTTRLAVLPLSGGDALYVAGQGVREDWLIDCGSESATEFVTQPFLRAQGVNRLSHFLLSHGDIRHVGGAERIARDFAVRQIHAGDVRFRSPLYQELVQQFQAVTNRLQRFRRGDRLGPWTVLHPDSGDRLSQADDNAAVLLARFDGLRVLLLSDLGTPGQDSLLRRAANDLRADVVVSGLPAATQPLTDPLLDAIRPKLIVITDADYPATARAPRALRDRLARRKVPVLYTRETGAVTLECRAGRWRYFTANSGALGDP
jgi:competence protein ComEC